jgi:hypothetical protein
MYFFEEIILVFIKLLNYNSNVYMSINNYFNKMSINEKIVRCRLSVLGSPSLITKNVIVSAILYCTLFDHVKLLLRLQNSKSLITPNNTNCKLKESYLI